MKNVNITKSNIYKYIAMFKEGKYENNKNLNFINTMLFYDGSMINTEIDNKKLLILYLLGERGILVNIYVKLNNYNKSGKRINILCKGFYEVENKKINLINFNYNCFKDGLLDKFKDLNKLYYIEYIMDLDGFLDILINNKTINFSNIIFNFKDISLLTLNEYCNDNNINLSGGSYTKRHMISPIEFKLSYIIKILNYEDNDLMKEITNSFQIKSQYKNKYMEYKNNKKYNIEFEKLKLLVSFQIRVLKNINEFIILNKKNKLRSDTRVIRINDIKNIIFDINNLYELILKEDRYNNNKNIKKIFKIFNADLLKLLKIFEEYIKGLENNIEVKNLKYFNEINIIDTNNILLILNDFLMNHYDNILKELEDFYLILSKSKYSNSNNLENNINYPK
jgi:hypothetical protein